MTYNYEAPLRHWQKQVNYRKNTIQELEEAGKIVPYQLRDSLKLAEGALKCWTQTAKEEAAARAKK